MSIALDIKIDLSQAKAAFGRLAAKLDDTTPIMRAIGTGLVESTHTRFEQAVDPEGRRWRANAPATLARKRGPGILRESGMRGGLMGSITLRAQYDSVEVGSNKVHARIHQLGGKAGRNLSVTIPARPYLGVNAADGEMMLDVVEGALDQALGSGASSGKR